ncbi:hypothetical protein GCM10011533_08360 [Streptosporangium jomthongense]|nr:hypothetical protein GCM10011533_08360 [Streptosporangium jomthongense]
MGRDDFRFIGHAEFFEHVGGVFHGGPVGFGAHDKSYKRLHTQLSCDNWKAGHCMFWLSAMQGSVWVQASYRAQIPGVGTQD